MEMFMNKINAPFFAVWYMTRRCNLACKHCFIEVMPTNTKPKELSTDEGKELIDRLADADVYQLAFAGGEPLVRPDLLELARYARDAGMTVQLATNGLGIVPERVKELLGAGFRCVQISLDGATPSTHDRLRGSGHFETTIASIRHATEGGLPVVLAIAVHRGNLHEVDLMIKLAQTEKAIILKLQPVWTQFNLGGNSSALELAEIQALVPKVETLATSAGIKLSLPRYTQIVAEAGAERTCLSDLRVATISSTGRLGICDFAPELASGDVLRDAFLPLWKRVVQNHQRNQRCGCTPFLERLDETDSSNSIQLSAGARL